MLAKERWLTGGGNGEARHRGAWGGRGGKWAGEETGMAAGGGYVALCRRPQARRDRGNGAWDSMPEHGSRDGFP